MICYSSSAAEAGSHVDVIGQENHRPSYICTYCLLVPLVTLSPDRIVLTVRGCKVPINDTSHHLTIF
jgi:hypothetical protein